MARISLSPIFLRDSLNVFRQRGLRGLLLGTTAAITTEEFELVRNIETKQTKEYRSGKLHKIDTIHKGSGTVYLAPDPHNKKQSIVAFGSDTKIANGPDLWLYVSDSKEPKKSYGDFLNLGLIKGNKGAQVYIIKKPYNALKDRKSVIIYCKQFDVLFSFAILS